MDLLAKKERLLNASEQRANLWKTRVATLEAEVSTLKNKLEKAREDNDVLQASLTCCLDGKFFYIVAEYELPYIS